jgi:hypothetical protein
MSTLAADWLQLSQSPLVIKFFCQSTFGRSEHKKINPGHSCAHSLQMLDEADQPIKAIVI